ncbi:endopeptidase La [Hornefia butyriciproducens]|jgi:ATP-dependent Lon protease|nr:endopeptidase La [Hornefia butyriciproducens]MCI7412366.1 endopeptidase La [Clostridiales bacterium]MCI7678607.1 endopeptidase La [Clostridiales bacterium]MDD6299601.1 endopeptidase La [Hornefia butyriciproducens]MDD7020844.1 endopeptidase La [Hornefia butyriciproducens]MDY2989901.1 endopeptidase La [Hornefia butyriciproducens]
MNEEYKNTEQMETLEGMIPAEEEESREEVVREVLPCIPLRGVSIFPHTVVHFDIGREKSIRALENAMASDKLMFVATQKDENILIPKVEDMYEIGTVVRVKQMLKIQGDAVRVLVEGICRGSIDQVITEETYISATINRLEEDIREEELSLEDKAAMRIIREEFVEYAALTSQITDEVVDKTLAVTEPGPMIDKIANELFVSCARKQNILGELNFSERLKALTELIGEENEIAVIEKELSQKVKENIDNGQREYFLREKLKAIQTELGVEEDAGAESAEWLEKLDELKLDEKVDEKVRKEISKFSKMMPSSAESSVIRNYVETILDLPWNKSSRVNSNLKKAEKILEEDHYGMKKVKERILEYLAVVHLSKAIRGPILCLVGPPGVGKTSIARSIARATGREFIRMSLGGVRDEAEIRGHRRTYIGAIPGRVINGIKDAGTNNPLFLFDEVDKIGADFRGDPASALLEVLDPEQNNTFTDHFLEIPFDLSKVMFITTANSVDTIPEPLLDRMEVIEVPGYTEQEKVKIAQKYLIPKEIKANGLKKENIRISENALHDLVNYYTRESGVRNLERSIGSVCRKVARRVVTEKGRTYNVTPRNLERYMGKHIFHYDVLEGENPIGVTTGMAWTRVGGDTLKIETSVVPGTGKLNLTGQLGDVMQESAKIGVSYVRSIASRYGIEEDFYKKYDMHIHVPEGAVPKDGPSAGVTMCTSVVSALTKTPVDREIAMTGEITLRGKVLPVGGIREKVLAAHRAGIRKILLPKENARDIDEIPQSVRRDLDFVLIEDVKEALENALVK